VWLAAGYCEFPDTTVMETTKGTPQGRVISPLLSNIALHGMEKVLGIKHVSTTGHAYGTQKYTLIRYADHFIVLAATEQDCIDAKALLDPWLAQRGLEFAPDKVNITNLRDGIKFLGCKVKIYGKTKPTLLITPHPDKVAVHMAKLKEIWLKYKGQAPHVVIRFLNPVITGWANYYSPWVSSEVFSRLDHFMWHRAWRFAKRRHPTKNHKWVAKTYFGLQEGSRNEWRFFGLWKGERLFLKKYSDVKIVRHVVVKNNMDPDDPSKESHSYWQKRDANRQLMALKGQTGRITIAKRQYHTCPICNETLYNEEELHVHHIRPRKNGGTNVVSNLVLLHEICHRQIHSSTFDETEMRGLISKLRKRFSVIKPKIVQTENTMD
jgi:RNA-directed DNA polymerase